MTTSVLPDRVLLDRLAAIREYLVREFPGSVIDSPGDLDAPEATFRISERRGRVRYILTALREFLHDYSEREIALLLQRWDVAGVMRQFPRRAVWLTAAGVTRDVA